MTITLQTTGFYFSQTFTWWGVLLFFGFIIWIGRMAIASENADADRWDNLTFRLDRLQDVADDCSSRLDGIDEAMRADAEASIESVQRSDTRGYTGR